MSDSDNQEKTRILLVVEDLAQMECLVNLPFRRNYQVRPVQSVADACSSLKKEVPHLIVTDIPPSKNAEDKLAQFIDAEPDLTRVKIVALARPDSGQAHPSGTSANGRIIRVAQTESFLDRIDHEVAQAQKEP